MSPLKLKKNLIYYFLHESIHVLKICGLDLKVKTNLCIYDTLGVAMPERSIILGGRLL